MLFGKPKQGGREPVHRADTKGNKGDAASASGPTGGSKTVVPTFETFMAQKLDEYRKLLHDVNHPDAELEFQKAIQHVNSLQLGPHAFDAIKNFFDTRDKFPVVNLIIAEDNEAVIKILQKGRSAKLRHVARTHRVNLDWTYDVFRFPEVICRYVKTLYQTADIGTKAINKGEDWDRLQMLMGIKRPGPINYKENTCDHTNVGMNKNLKTVTTKDQPQSIGQKTLMQWLNSAASAAVCSLNNESKEGVSPTVSRVPAPPGAKTKRRSKRKSLPPQSTTQHDFAGVAVPKFPFPCSSPSIDNDGDVVKMMRMD